MLCSKFKGQTDFVTYHGVTWHRLFDLSEVQLDLQNRPLETSFFSLGRMGRKNQNPQENKPSFLSLRCSTDCESSPIVIPSLRFKLLQLRRMRLFLLLDTGSDWLVRFCLPFLEVCMRAHVRASLSMRAYTGYPLLVSLIQQPLGACFRPYGALVPQLLHRVTCCSVVRGEHGHRRPQLLLPFGQQFPSASCSSLADWPEL